MSLDPSQQRTAPRARTNRSRLRRPRDIARPAIEPTFHSRYECKYIVDPSIVADIRDYIRPFTQPDGFAALRPGYRYPICSLYLDSPDLLMYQQTVNGEKDRFKLRVRTYSDHPTDRVYFEVKRKVNTVVHKRRAALTREQAAAVLDREPIDLDALAAEDRRDIENFDHHVMLTEARPVVRIKYSREAYQATGDEPVRITVDTDLQHAISLDPALSHRVGRWTSTPLDGVILEIKFTERYPWWVQQFIRAFGLKQQAMPKYVLSIDHLLLQGRESVLALAGMTLPPRRS